PEARPAGSRIDDQDEARRRVSAGGGRVRRMSGLSLRARLTIWYTVTLLVVLVLAGATVIWEQRRIGLRRVDRQLDDLVSTLARVTRDEFNEGDASPAAEAVELVGAPGFAVAIFEHGQPIAAAWNGLTLSAPISEDTGSAGWDVAGPDGPWRV